MQARLLDNTEINKVEWDEFIRDSTQGSIFLETIFIDALLPEGWSGILIYENDSLQAIMPLNIKSKWGIKYAFQPIYSKYWGIAFRSIPFANTYKEISFKKKVTDCVIECIANNINNLEYYFHYNFDFGSPFIRKSFTVGVGYTNVLDVGGKSEDEIFNQYSKTLRKTIRQAESSGIKIINEPSLENLFNIERKNHKSGKKIIPELLFKRLEHIQKNLFARQKSFVMSVIDQEGNAISTGLFLEDEKSIYVLQSITDHNFKNSGATSLLLHEAIKRAASGNKKFDFLGSMIESIEDFNRAFGARPVPYLNILKKNFLVSVVGK